MAMGVSISPCQYPGDAILAAKAEPAVLPGLDSSVLPFEGKPCLGSIDQSYGRSLPLQ